YADNAILAVSNPSNSYTTFAGQTIGMNAVFIKMARGADANLDGVVDNQDSTIVGNSFGKSSSGQWCLGDFDYDGTCGGTDVSILGTTYNPSAPPLGPVQLAPDAVSASAAVSATAVSSDSDVIYAKHRLHGRWARDVF